MKTFRLLFAGFVVSLICNHLGAGPGDLDLSFDGGSRFYGTVGAFAVQADGKVLVGGGFATVPGAVRRNLARLNLDGSADRQFREGMDGPDAEVNAIAVQADGRILIGGQFHSVNGIPRTGLARLNVDGSVDESFAVALVGEDPNVFVNCIAVAGDGSIVISGTFTNVNGQARPGLARLLAEGNLDNAFLNGLPGPQSPYGGGINVTVQRDGKVVIAGQFATVNGVPRSNLARLNLDGTVDTTFLDNMSGPDNSVLALGLQSDDRIVIAGYFASVNGVPSGRIARLNSDGSTDTTFCSGQSGVNYSVYHLSVQSDDRILIGGNFSVVNGAMRHRFARLNADGSLDTGFLNGMTGADNNVGPVIELPNGRVLIGGQFERFNNVLGMRGFACLNADGSVDTDYFPSPMGPDGCLYSLVLQPDGRVVIGGVFRSVNSVPYSCIARLHPDGSLDSSFQNASSLSDSIYGLALQPDGKVLAWGRGLNLARVNSDGSRDATFVPALLAGDSRPHCLAIQENGRILIGGQFTTVNRVSRGGIARLNANGSFDTSHSASVTGGLATVYVIALLSDGKALIGGHFTAVNGVVRPFLARLNPDGSLDTAFFQGLAGPNGSPGCIVVQPDGRIVIWGYFTEVNGVARPGLVRLHPNGALDDTFMNGLSGPNGTVFAMVLQSDGRILLGGGFTEVNGVARQGLARLNADGSLDESFQEQAAGVNSYVLSFATQPDGNILIGGQFTAVNGIARAFVARLIGGSSPRFLSEPQSRTAESGCDVVFRARVEGYPEPACQWYQEDDPMPGATNAAQRLACVQITNAGHYRIVASNAAGSITSAPAMLSVIPPVERRLVPGIRLGGAPGSTLNLECTEELGASTVWTSLDHVVLNQVPQWWFDLSADTQARRFYRASQAAPGNIVPTLELDLIPALTLTGIPSDTIRIEAINIIGPTDAWFLLDTVTLTNTSQLYFDVTAPGQSQRVYRLTPVP